MWQSGLSIQGLNIHIHTYTHIYACNNNKKKARNMKESKEEYMGGLGERK